MALDIELREELAAARKFMTADRARMIGKAATEQWQNISALCEELGFKIQGFFTDQDLADALADHQASNLEFAFPPNSRTSYETHAFQVRVRGSLGNS